MRAILFPVVILSACAGVPLNEPLSVPVPQERVYATYPRFFTGAYITVRRDPVQKDIGVGCENEIYIDNIRSYTIMPGEYASFFLTDGKHVVKVDTGRGSCQGKPSSETINVSNGISQEYKLLSPPGGSLRLFRTM
ncbi:hypothetical protein SAMN05192560_1289 [Methylobacillus rhizosphaerae]|uniref:Lipoprotein n=1 Tax=Methylobacillus rhizosphaerae TaxID=551994 RepID=A0A238ZJY3_9PROT|nr:hypothetical protein [Methylobacillus rhizosphaerae]SNR83288.1 hypothetical protein SAMN05192560_1289 [Methylobacillus rhizosphaerae]